MPKTVKQSLNPAFLKQKVEQEQIEKFDKEFSDMLGRINEKESEEFHKGLIKDFLNAVYYERKHYINTKDDIDLVIHNTQSEKSPVGVVIETKSPTAKTEMISLQNLNLKSLQQLVYYYMKERKTQKNFELRHLIITNLYEWFVFDAQNFEKLFYGDNKFVKRFEEFEAKTLAGTKTDFFYKEIAKDKIETIKNDIIFTHFDIRKENHEHLYKFFAPENLLKIQSETTDSNQLNKEFYGELLYIIGLEEIADGGKKIIVRKKENRDHGSIIENAIEQIEYNNKAKNEEDAVGFAFDLAITWINRILFLKLLESQILKYHSQDKNYAFLSTEKLSGYGDLNMLFFGVLAKKINERNERVSAKFANVPYLNSSLFEQTDMENETIGINSLDDNAEIAIYPKSVLNKNARQGDVSITSLRLKPLEYFLKFLDAYDFSGENSDKTLISAAVLGLIFEKINGHKDGSFFTPSFITMYMCRETIGRSVVQKFNEVKGWKCENITDLYNKIADIAITEANAIFNSIKICDPSVGSGHFLVSALNEMIYLKSELGILADKNGKRLRDYQISIENDELIVKNSDGDIFAYNPRNIESQRVQETFFNEKQTIIENCLFGVDINPNSVKICRLRLWIELLKNTYYRPSFDSAQGTGKDLETLPNIDINIKCGNSLISRFDLRRIIVEGREIGSGNLATTTQKIHEYKTLVSQYKKCSDIKEGKKNIRENIAKIKKELYEIKKHQDLDFLEWQAAKTKYDNHLSSMRLDEKRWDTEREKLEKELEKREKTYQEKAASNAFEWSFEFPEVLDEKGDFVGFDLVIGNPPYGTSLLSETEKKLLKNNYETFEYQANTYVLFYEKGTNLLKEKGMLAFITPATFANQFYFKKIRNFLQKYRIENICKYFFEVFEEADIGDTATLIISKNENKKTDVKVLLCDKQEDVLNQPILRLYEEFFNQDGTYNLNSSEFNIQELYTNTVSLTSATNVIVGIKAYQKGKGNPKQTEHTVENKIFTATTKINDTYIPCIIGKDFHRYCLLNSPAMFLSYGKWLAEPRETAPFFDDEKIVLRQTSDCLIAHLETNKYINLNNVYNIGKIDETFSLKYLLALLNSRLLNSVYQKIAQEKGRLFAEVKKVNLGKLPIKKVPLSEQQPFIALVDEILSAKKENPAADTSELEREIDLLVYGLYGLSEEI
ncbi:MAG: Eco57I restriction-modification methylase domain-containing protein [Chitinivibrionia bacterium]|nr:Eco57I restriction-modification methylase domain-containing protein [Chitinivibrionia bacterium]